MPEQQSSPTTKRRKRSFLSISWATTKPERFQTNLSIRRNRRITATYTYKALNPGEIRLLYLLPGKTGDPLHGMISHMPYKLAGDYRALSYVWGTSQKPQELLTPDGRIRITMSLSKALQALRQRNSAMVLWVDAICIDQSNNTEKSKQIRLLPEIFQTATITYAFLKGGKKSDAALKMLMQVRSKGAYDKRSQTETPAAGERVARHARDSESETDSEENTEKSDHTSPRGGPNAEDNWPKDLSRIPKSWNGRSIPRPDDSIWTSAIALFAQPLFRRVWVIQEIVAATNVRIVCGNWIIDWSDLHCALEIVDRHFNSSDDEFAHLEPSWQPFLCLAGQREWEARRHRWSLMTLLENFRYTESTLSRDRFFALLGLASDGNEADFEPDYDSPFEAVILKFARVFIRQGRGMQLLYRAGLSRQSHRFPSWIPDWTSKRSSSLVDSSESGTRFAASGSRRANVQCNSDRDELVVEGYAVDIIANISATSNVEPEWKKYFEEVDEMINSAIPCPTPDTREQLKWKIPIAGMIFPQREASESLDMQSSYESFRETISSDQISGAMERTGSFPNNTTKSVPCASVSYAKALEQVESDHHRLRSASYTAALQGIPYGWRFIVTEKGYLGIVPNEAKIGDVVAILQGGRIPFVLKASVTRPGAFRLVGG
ncbi:MAG: hypothetical protein Q9219_005381, partial [cf. Caloplaca sp. 3 TL-2023]